MQARTRRSATIAVALVVAVMAAGPLVARTVVAATAILGDANIEATPDASQVGLAEATQFSATASGTVTSLSIYLDPSNRATRFELGLYADASGAPGALLAKGAAQAAQAAGWNSVAIPATALTAATRYWIARLATAGGDLVARIDAGVPNPDRGDPRVNATLPSAFGSGGSWPHLTSIYASGAPIPTPSPAPTPTPTPAPTSTPIPGSAGFVGDGAIESTPDGSPIGVAEANRYVAMAGGAVTSLSIYVDASNRATGLELGLYADGSAAPGALLAKAALASVRNGAWNTVAIPSTALTNGSGYWIGRLSTAGGDLVTRVNPAVANPDRTDTRSLSTLPASFTPAGSYPHLTSMYAGSAPAPTPTPTPGSFTCTEVIGYSQTSNWYSVDVPSAFESAVVDARYQLRYELGAAVHDWADPSFGGWSGIPFSPCAAGSGAPDRVVMDVSEDFFIDDGDPAHDRSRVLADVRAVITTIQQKYPAVRSIYLQPVVGGPGGTTQCTINGYVIRASANHPHIDAVIAQAGGGIVVSGPSPTVRTCADYLDDGLYVGHLTTAAKGPIGQTIGSFYATRP